MYNLISLYVFTVYGLAAGAAQNGPAGCVLPPYPPHGTYAVYNRPEAVPGQTYDSANLTVSCDFGYGVVGSNITYCSSGNIWIQPMPQCTWFCRLTPDPSVKYSCKVTGDDILISGTRKCHESEPDGTVVVPECNRPVYYSSGVLLNMRCVQGNWDHIAVCQPDCGTFTPVGEGLIINGTKVKHGELPWHAAIYDKNFIPFKQVCGGSLISTRVVISAAHCFWEDPIGRQPASRYAVALGKIYRPWNNTMDPGVHHSHVSEIKIPILFMGAAGNYQADIALVVMATPVVYVTYIRPVCIDFDDEFDRNQLQNTNAGRVSGWGLTSEDGVASQELLTTELSYVDVSKCIANLPINFRQYITNEKICAGGNATTVCRGDSGGGLAFPHMDRGNRWRYFLRGVMSTAPINIHKCTTNSYVTFTHILPHATFIKDHGLDVVSVNGGSICVAGCVLPAYPPHGTYTVLNRPDAAPGQTLDTAILTVTCDHGHEVVGSSSMTYCSGRNAWQGLMPQCSRSSRDCILPQYPDHGRYAVPSKNDSRPGDHFEGVYLSYECDPGYELMGYHIVTCYRGVWALNFLKCAKLCKLNSHPSVNHKCHLPSAGSSGFRPCNPYERNGTMVTPECNSPYYYHAGVLKIMTCMDGDWDYVPVCEPDCGRVTPDGVPTAIGGRSAQQVDLPWHAWIGPSSINTPWIHHRTMKCGGSLVSTTMVISAADCFWDDIGKRLYPATDYAVELGKIYRSRGNTHDEGRQTFNVRDVKITPRFSGSETLYQEDIALVFLEKPAVYHPHVRPICLDFDINFDRRQLEDGKKGKLQLFNWWKRGDPTELMELSILSLSECITRVHSSFRQYITSDKFCAGNWNESRRTFKEDRGAGLAFAESERNTERFYLRGVVSSSNGPITLFSMISRHEEFIKQYLRI